MAIKLGSKPSPKDAPKETDNSKLSPLVHRIGKKKKKK